MLKKLLFIYFGFFTLCLMQAEENQQEAVEWKDITGKEIFLFVNNTNKLQKNADGSKKAPFKTIEDAFTYLSGLNKKEIKVIIYVTGNFTSKNVYVITVPTKIVGLDDYRGGAPGKRASSYIGFEKNAGFVVTSSKLFIEKCTISRREFVNEPRSVPILYSSNSTINIKNITLSAKEGGSLFKFIESSVSMDTVILNSNQNGYCNIIEAIKSNLKIKAVRFNCKGRFVVSINSTDSSLNIENVHCNINAHLFAIVLKINSGEVNIENSFFNAEGKYTMLDEAITYWDKAKINIKDLKLKGFMREKKEKTR